MGWPARSATPNVCAMVARTRPGSLSGASGMKDTPSAKASLLCEPGPPATELLRCGRGVGGLFQGGASAISRAVITFTGDILSVGARCNAPGGARDRPVLPGTGSASGTNARHSLPGWPRTGDVQSAGEIVQCSFELKAGYQGWIYYYVGERLLVGILMLWIVRAAPTNRLGRLNPPAPQCIEHRLCAVVERKLAQDRRNMVLHRLCANAKCVGDLFITAAGRDPLQHLDFTIAQRLKQWKVGFR